MSHTLCFSQFEHALRTWGSFEIHTLFFYDIICSHFCGLLSCNSPQGDTSPGTRDLVLLRLVMLQVQMLQLLLPLLFWVVSKQRQLLGPISVVHRCRRLRSSFTTEAKKQKPAWTCGVVLYTSHTTATPSHSYGWLHRGSSSSSSSSSKSASTATLFQSVEFFFFPSDENRNDFRLSSSLPPGSFPNHL